MHKYQREMTGIFLDYSSGMKTAGYMTELEYKENNNNALTQHIFKEL